MSSTRRRKALLVGIDGCNLSRIDAVRAPTLRWLRDRCYYAPGTIYPDSPDGGEPVMTVSGPGWASILTGTWPWTHDVLDNDIANHRLAAYPDLITRATRAGLRTFYAVTWLPLADLILTREVTERAVLDQDHWPDFELAVAGATVHAVASGADLAFAYFGSPDEQAHRFGATSSAYDSALESVDGHLAALLRTIEARNDEDWLVLVTTDHGHRPEGGHGGQSEAERSTFVLGTGGGLDASWSDARAGRPTREGRSAMRMVDVAPTLLSHLGVDIPADPRAGTAIDGVARMAWNGEQA